MKNLKIDQSKSYRQLESAGIIGSEFYEINDIGLTKAYALERKPINVIDADTGAYVGLAFSSVKSAADYIESVNDVTRYDGVL